MTTNTRTDKSFKNLASFSKEVLVSCPHCNKRAMVITKFSEYYVPFPMGDDRKSKFRCNNCYKQIDENIWYGPIVISPANRKCGNCGSDLKDEHRLVKKLPKQMKVKCKVCEVEKYYDTKHSLTYANSDQATDPYFGLPLWLQVPFDEHILWAYNFEHLTYLKEYVGAKLREAASGGKYSLAWKLPNFIKVAKNRDKILKAIGRLEKRI
jgi:DNA-directed RNA polymerase subunit RPC12/RpoP